MKTAGVIRYSCGILFILFSFAYLFFMQGDLLAQAQFVFSRGVTHYSIPIGALVITAVLQILQWIVSLVVKLPSRWHALTYYPSFLALAMLTDFNRDTINDFHWGAWGWLLPLLIILFFVLIRLAEIAEEVVPDTYPNTFSSKLWPNYLVMLVMIVFCGGCHRAPDTYHYELKTERLILEGRYADAAQVGIKSLVTTERLNNLRCYALSKEGLLAEHLFDYPQPFGVNGLLNVNDIDTLHYRFDAGDICFSLGALKGKNVRSLDSFLKLVEPLLQHRADSLAEVDSFYLASSDSIKEAHLRRLNANTVQRRRAADYHLCSLLLRKKVQQFASLLPSYYPKEETDSTYVSSLPRSYREAMTLLNPELADSITRSQYDAYVHLRDSLSYNPLIQTNKTRREFGDTYWWYYDH